MATTTGADGAATFLEQAHADPSGYRARVDDLLRGCGDDALARVHVVWGHGVALHHLGAHDEARRELQRAVELATACGAASVEALVRSSLALSLLHLGETEAALHQTEVAAQALTGAEAARNEMQRGLVLQRLGRQDDAIAAYDRARPQLEAAGDLRAIARLLSNRGVLHAYRGDLGSAQADLERSVALARELGARRAIALGLQNLGFVAGRQGRIPEALALLEEADRLLQELDDAPALAVLDTDRAELLADVGLFDEASERAEAAAQALADDQVNGAEAELLLARISLLGNRPIRAAELADALAERFRAGGRDGWELHARYVSLAARADEVDPEAAARLADELQAGGWATEAWAARVLAARHALRRGNAAWAAELLEELRGASRRAPALARAHHWYATALARVAADDRTGARRAIGTGLDLLDRSRLVFGSAELRAHATAQAVDLVGLAIRLALEDGRPAEALRALDRVRATDVGVRVLPPDDPQLAGDLAELRRLAEVERRTAHAGDDVAPVLAVRAEVERRLRDRARAVAADGGDAAGLRLDVAALRRSLAGRTLVAYLRLDGRLHAIEVAPRRTRHHLLGNVEDVRVQVSYLRAAVRRLAFGRGSAASLTAAEASIARSVTQLVELLGLDRFDPDGLVVVPSAPLDGLPWGALARPLGHLPVVAPSARAWLAAAERRHDPGPLLLVAGPDLPGGAGEVAQLASRYRQTQLLAGDDATVASVRRALPDAGAVHLAAHGRFRADNPLFSSLRLVDGQLTAYELEQLPRVPERWVLPSCDAAAATTVPGDAVLGLSSVLLRLGARSIVAPTVEVADQPTTTVMLDLHARLAAGADEQAALSDTIAAVDDEGAAVRAAAAAFVVVGRG